MVLLCGAPARSKTTTAVGFCEVASEQLEGFETHHICFDELEAVGRAGASAARFDVEVWSTACRVAFDRTAELLHTPIRLAPHDWWLCTITCTSTVCAVSTSAGRGCRTHNKRMLILRREMRSGEHAKVTTGSCLGHTIWLRRHFIGHRLRF